MNAPISRVLPTPVAKAKHKDGKSRSKLSTGGKPRAWLIAWTASSAVSGGPALPKFKPLNISARISNESAWGLRRDKRWVMVLS